MYYVAALNLASENNEVWNHLRLPVCPDGLVYSKDTDPS